MSRAVRLFVSASLVLPAAAWAQRTPAPPPVASELFNQLKWRHIGPEGSRVSAVAGVIGDPNVYYAGAASGGIFKSTDGGLHWEPVFDSMPVSSIGALAVAPSDPNVVWAGTGESSIRSNVSLGWGMYKSTDAGKTWIRSGLDSTGRIARIVIHPTNPDVVYATAVGRAYGPQQHRGVYRTMDGGKSWERVLFVDENTGAYAVAMDPVNPRILYASTWEFVIHTWGRKSGGAGSGIWKSVDGGTTWKRLTGNGLPSKPIGKTDLAVARTNPNRVYALIETSDGVPLPGVEAESGELWRSDDGGAKWELVSHDRELAGRTQYYTRMAVMPDNADEAYFLTSGWTKTLDGGRTSINPPFTEVPGGDHHDIWIDPGNANRMAVGHDGGISITTNRGKTWNAVQLPIAQMYHVTVDTRIPYYVYGNRQDGPSARGPSNSRMFSFWGDIGIPRGMWHSVGGGESGWATPDPEDPNLVWSSASGFGSVGGIVARYDVRTGIANNIEIWPEMTAGHSAKEVKYRFNWTFPVVISPHDRNTLYVGSQHVHSTSDGGKTWRVLGPDLTRNDTTRQGVSGGLTPDNIGVEYTGVVFAIAESKLTKGLIWAGTNDGLVQLSQDGGRTWANVTPKTPGMPEWGTVSNIQPSRYDAATAYVTVDGHQVDNREPWVLKTTDLGKSWKLIVSGIPRTPLSYAHWVKEDPVRRGLLYLGTENALYVSFNDGELWQPLQSNLPHAPVHDITVQEHFNDLVIATYGRGFWILDDITPLQQLTSEVAGKDAHLFAPRPAYRFRGAEAPFFAYYDPVAGQNPPYGAMINYLLKTKQDSVSIALLDATGKVVRTIKDPPKAAGINRVTWNLQMEQTKEPLVRTPPMYAPHVRAELAGKASPSLGRVALLAPPGRYTVRLRVGGQEFTQPLELRKDPNTPGTEQDITAQMALAGELTRTLDSVVEMTNTIESVRLQLATLKALAKEDTAVVRATDSLEKKFVGVEEQLTQVRITGRGQDLIRYPAKTGEKLVYLLGDISSTDNAPTASQREVGGVLRQRARAARDELDRIIQTDLDQFNRLLREKGLGGIFARVEPPKVP